MDKKECIVKLSEKAIDTTENVLSWLNKPKEEARLQLVNIISDNTKLTAKEKIALIYHSRKLVKEYANLSTIYEQAKKQIDIDENQTDIDDDWLHFFFDKAEKVSNESMQFLWSKLLAGEFNKPGSVSRKLLHIISIMDIHSARSFQTFSLYVFERYQMFTSSYNTEAVMIPFGFYENSFDFMKKTEKWLKEAGYSDYKDLALNLTMNEGELNSLENLGLVQNIAENKCGIPLIYNLNGEKIMLSPEDNYDFPLGKYSFTQEGMQLYQIINGSGNEVALTITIKNLESQGVKFNKIKI